MEWLVKWMKESASGAWGCEHTHDSCVYRRIDWHVNSHIATWREVTSSQIRETRSRLSNSLAGVYMLYVWDIKIIVIVSWAWEKLKLAAPSRVISRLNVMSFNRNFISDLSIGWRFRISSFFSTFWPDYRARGSLFCVPENYKSNVGWWAESCQIKRK